MEHTRSRNGTRIAYERTGRGPVVVLIASALADHSDAKRLARHLSENFTVINYDRRGRGESEAGAGSELASEVEDIAAVIDAAGGSAACSEAPQAPS